MKDLQKQLRQFSQDTRTIFLNLEKLMVSAALINVSVMTYLGLTSKVDLTALNVVGQYATMGSCLVIAFIGAWQFIKFLDR